MCDKGAESGRVVMEDSKSATFLISLFGGGESMWTCRAEVLRPRHYDGAPVNKILCVRFFVCVSDHFKI